MSNPGFSKLTFNTGTANSTAITFNAGAYDFSTETHVTLSSDYARIIPPGYPNSLAGAVPGNHIDHPQTILSGQRVLFYQPEAQALVTAGAGSFS